MPSGVARLRRQGTGSRGCGGARRPLPARSLAGPPTLWQNACEARPERLASRAWTPPLASSRPCRWPPCTSRCASRARTGRMTRPASMDVPPYGTGRRLVRDDVFGRPRRPREQNCEADRMPTGRLAAAVTIAILLSAVPGHARDWFVRSGSTGDGTIEKPFADPALALDEAGPGDTIHVAQGVYHGKLEAGTWVVATPDLTWL